MNLVGRAVGMMMEMRTSGSEPVRWRCSTDLANELEMLSAGPLGKWGFNVMRRMLLTLPVVVDADLPPNALILEAQDEYPFVPGSLVVKVARDLKAK